MSDLISRQAAIEEVSDWVAVNRQEEIFKQGMIDILRDLPSAQPDDRLAKIAALVEGTIDHFDLNDAMDLLYQIKEVLK